MPRPTPLLAVPLVALVAALGACSEDVPPSLDYPVVVPTSTGRRPGAGPTPNGSGEKPNRSTYDRTCTTNADCVLVSFAEAPCDTCKCPNYAISVDDQRKFFDEEQAFRQTCNETPKPCLADCAPLAARCVASQCTVVETGAPPPPADAGAPDAAAFDAGAD